MKKTQQKSSKKIPGTKKTPRILIVEDERAMAEVLLLKLQQKGYVVTHANHGDEALAMIQTEMPDCVLLDLIMPFKDGFELLRELKGKYSFPVIVLSNLSQDEDRERAHRLGVSEFLVKSDLQLSDIVRCVAHILSR